MLIFFCCIAALIFYISDSNSINYNVTTNCNPSNKSLFAKFLLRQWFSAKSELGISPDPSFVKLTSESQHVLTIINSFYHALMVFYTVRGDVIPFAMIWKCASEGIAHNLYPLTTYGKNTKERAQIYHEIDTGYNLATIIVAINSSQFAPIPRGGKALS